MNVETAAVRATYRICAGGGDPGDARAAAIRAWRGSLGDDDAVLGARYDALCVHAPNGPALLRFVEHGDDGVVGFLAVAPRRMRAGRRELRAGVLSHLAIAPAHRSLGPALMLLDAVLAASAGRFDLVYGIPNANEGASAALRRAGMQPWAMLERRVRIVRHGPYLDRRAPRWLARPAGLALDALDATAGAWRFRRRPRLSGRWATRFEAAMDAPWAAAADHPAITAVRDETMLRWRFDAAVGNPVRYFLVTDEADAVRAWFACVVEPQWPHVLDVHDFWSLDGCGAIDRAALHLLMRAARRDGRAAVSLRAAIAREAAEPWYASGFRPRGGQQVFVRWLDPRLAASPPPAHLTYIDQDG
ncbi:hypothetical protein [Luteimonas sp. MC1895]|uniref:hypothetical protein n=1 Tax=Luteimonas sp. MC1895 TaxID=2819513 RepID=UPI0018F0BCAC|nr:hypothetical protein [Luteimonas sp. MC1895]MBJ6978213.1 hypothetical protein [Luteimonas sp. MC1895]